MNTIGINDHELIQADDISYQYSGISSFCQIASHKISWPYVCWLVFAGFISCVVYALTQSKGLGSINLFLCIYYFVVILNFSFRLKACGKPGFFSPDILFTLMYTLFHLGYVTLYAIGVTPFLDEIIIYVSAVPKSLFIINLGLISFLLAYEVFGMKRTTVVPKEPKIPGIGWAATGITLMILSLIVYACLIASVGLEFFKSEGRRAVIYTIEFMPYYFAVLFTRIPFIFLFGMIIYCISSALRYRKLFNSKLALALAILFLIIVSMQVSRGLIFQTLIISILIRHYLIKPVKITYLVMLVFCMLALFAGMKLIKSIVFDPSRMVEEIKYQAQSGQISWFDPFVEAGTSFNVLNITANEIPDRTPYWKGASWRDAVIHIVPFLQNYTLKHGISTWAPSSWVTTTFYGYDRAGRGYSVAAEGYLNFGYPGVVIEMMFFGIFLRWLMIRFSMNPSAIWALVFLGCFSLTLLVVRNHIGMLTGFWSQIFMLAFFLKYTIGNGIANKEATQWVSLEN